MQIHPIYIVGGERGRGEVDYKGRGRGECTLVDYKVEKLCFSSTKIIIKSHYKWYYGN